MPLSHPSSLAVLVLLLPCVSVRAADNLLRNPGFEAAVTDVGGGEAPEGWSLNSSWYAKPKGAGLSSVALDRAVVHTGSVGLRLTGRQDRGMAWQVVTKGFAPGDRLRVSAYAKVRDLDRGLAWLRLECKHQGKVLRSLAAHTDRYEKGISDWVELRAEGTVPDGTSVLQLFVCTSEPNSGTVWFDDVRLQTVEPPPEDPGPPAEANAPSYVGLVPLDLFDASEIAWASGAWGGRLDTANPVSVHEDQAGERHLRVEFATPKSFVLRKWDYTGEWTALCFRARQASGSGSVSVLIAAGGLGHYTASVGGLGREWKTYAIPLAGFRNDRNGKPLSRKQCAAVIRFFAHKAMTLDIGPITLAVPPGIRIREAYTDQPANVFEPGAAPTVHVSVLNSGENTVQTGLSCTLRDYRGRTLHTGRTSCSPLPNGLGSSSFSLPELATGYYSCELTLGDDVVRDRAGLGIVVMPLRPSTPIPRPFLGFSVFGHAPDLAVRLWMHRLEIPMFSYRNEPPVQPVTETVRGLGLCLDNGMTPIGFFVIHPNYDRLPRHVLTRSEGGKWSYDLGALEEHTFRVAREFRDHIRVWSVAGEANLFSAHLEGGRDTYVRAALAAVKGIRRAVPSAEVFSIGVSGSDPYQGWAFAKHAWKTLGPHLDGVYSDNYPSGWLVQEGLRAATPESYLRTHLLDMLDHMGPGKRIGVEEAGYQLDPTLPPWHELTRRRAEYAARCALITAGIPRADEYHWYTQCKGSVRSPWGIVLSAGRHANPGPAAATYATVARLLWDATEPVKVDLHREIWAYVYRTPRGAMAVAWSTADQQISFSLPGLRELGVLDADGADVAVAADHLFLSGSPVYLCAPGLDPGSLVTRLEAATYSLPPAKLAFVVERVDTVRVLISNQRATGVLEGAAHLSVSHAVRPGASGSSASLTIGPAATASRLVRLDPPLSPGHGDVFELAGRFVTDRNEQAAYSRHVRLWALHRMPQRARIDGDLTEWTGREPIVLNRADDVCPPDAVTTHKLWTGPEDLSAKLWLGWDDAGLYLAAEVTDRAHSQTRTGSSIWANDCLHLGFDMLNDTLPPDFSGQGGHDGHNDFEIGLALTEERGAQAYEWYSGSVPARGLLGQVAFAAVREGDRTVYELALPWEHLGGYKPASGRVLGFGFVVMNSNDGSNAPYWLQFTPGICGGKDPSRYDSFALVE